MAYLKGSPIAQKARWYMALPIKTILQEKDIISTAHQSKKKIVIKEKAICKSIYKKGHLSNTSDL